MQTDRGASWYPPELRNREKVRANDLDQEHLRAPEQLVFSDADLLFATKRTIATKSGRRIVQQNRIFR
jgi:hypothetical protein